MRLPWVSRRRHEAEVERRRHREHDEWREFHCVQVRFWRDRVVELRHERDAAREEAYWRRDERDVCRKVREQAQTRVAELEQAIREHFESFDGDSTDPRNTRLWSVLDGQEPPDPPPAEPDTDLIGHMEQPNPKPRRRRLGPDWQHLQGGSP